VVLKILVYFHETYKLLKNYAISKKALSEKHHTFLADMLFYRIECNILQKKADFIQNPK